MRHLWLALALVCVPNAVMAQDANSLLEQGIAARQAGDDQRALGLFQQANQLSPSGVARAQIGLAEQALGLWVSAHEHLREALASPDDFVERNRAILEQALEAIASHLGTVELMGGVPGATVRVNGRDEGTLPLAQPLRVEVGSAILDVRADGYHPFNRTLTVIAGQSARETVTLVALEPGVASEPSARADAATSAAAAGSWDVAPASSSGGGGDPGAPFLALGLTFAVLTAALGAMTIGFGVAREDNAQEFNSSDRCLDGAGARTVAACPDLVDAVNSNEAAAIGSGVGVGISAIATVIFFAVYGASGSSSGSAAIHCGGGPGDLGLACGGRF